MIGRLLHHILYDSVWPTDPSMGPGLTVVPKLILLRLFWWVSVAYIAIGMIIGSSEQVSIGLIFILICELFAMGARTTAIHAATLVLLRKQQAHMEQSKALPDESNNEVHEG